MKKTIVSLIILTVISITIGGCMKVGIKRWDNGYDRPHIEEEEKKEEKEKEKEKEEIIVSIL